MAINNINTSLTGLTGKTGTTKTVKQDDVSESTDKSSVKDGVVAQDKVQLTEQAQSLSRLQQKIADAPDIDNSRVSAIKAAIERGDYKIDSQKIADKMIAQDAALFSKDDA